MTLDLLLLSTAEVRNAWKFVLQIDSAIFVVLNTEQLLSLELTEGFWCFARLLSIK